MRNIIIILFILGFSVKNISAQNKYIDSLPQINIDNIRLLKIFNSFIKAQKNITPIKENTYFSLCLEQIGVSDTIIFSITNRGIFDNVYLPDRYKYAFKINNIIILVDMDNMNNLPKCWFKKVIDDYIYIDLNPNAIIDDEESPLNRTWICMYAKKDFYILRKKQTTVFDRKIKYDKIIR